MGGWRPAAPAAAEKFAHTERLGSEPPTPPLTLMQEERKEKKKVMRGPVNNERDGVRVDVSGAE